MGSVDNVLQTESMTVVPSSSGGALLGRDSVGRRMGTGRCGSVSDLPRRRRVFAVRDFPPGCGRFAAPLVSRANEGVVCVGTDADLAAGEKSDNVNENHCIRPPETVAEIELVGELKSLDPILMNGEKKSAAEEPAASPDERNVIESVNVEPVVVRRPETSIGAYQVVQHQAQDVSKDSKKVDYGASVAEMVQKKKYPARRSISVVRDFPPFCGRNVPRLVKGEAAEMLSRSENKVFGQETCDIAEKTLEVTQKTNAKEMGRDVHGGDVQKSLSARPISVGQAESAVPYAKETGNRNEYGTSHSEKKTTQQNAQENSFKSTDESVRNLCERKSEIDMMSSDNSQGSEECGRELVVSTEDVISEKKLSGQSGSRRQTLVVKFKLLECIPRGIVVQGLMAAPNCPWRQKKLHQFDRMSEIVTKPGGESRGLENPEKESIVFIEKSSPEEKFRVPLCSEDQMSVEGKLAEFDGMSEVVAKSGVDSRDLEDDGKELVVHMEEDRSLEEHFSVPCSKDQKSVEIFDSRELRSNRSVVQGLMASKTCPWRQWKVQNNPDVFPGDISETKGKKNDFVLLERSKSSRKQKKKVENMKGSKTKIISPPAAKDCLDVDKMIMSDKECDFERGKECNNFQLIKRSHNFGVSVPPLPSRSVDKADENDAIVTRNQVRETLRLYQAVFRKLLQAKEAKAKEGGNTVRRIDLQAAKILKEKGKYVNVGKPIIGIVPGVEVGDEFHYWVELNIIGLHRTSQAGIDYVKQGQNVLATSIVASGGYDDDADNSDVLIYTGQGGNITGAGKEPMDQKLERGNLALKNSLDEQNPVRVIRGETKESNSPESRGRTYVYGGLYLVEKYWQEIGPHGTLVFKFKLVRIPGQPELAWKAVKKSKKLNVRQGLCVDDISQGKEKIPICAVNTIDDQKPPPFEYVTRMIYPDWLHLIPPISCDCTNGCSESANCSCVAKNGEEIPYNHDGAIVEAKPLVYECGPRCKCPPSCYNRVSQHGIRFQLEIFKTDTRGWGVRSLNSIPSGSFICEYAGELLDDTEAEKRTGNDEYLFDIGNDQNESAFWDGLSTLVPEVLSSSKEFVEEGRFTIDAARFGSVGRFVNHSCSPNLYAQNVLYDHGDKRIPHIMLFAAENIPPLKELTYDYNYMIDQVFDSNGNIKKKNCCCGSSECTGRMY